MKLPFSFEEFLNVFEEYNRAIWPLQIVAYLLGILVVVAALSRFARSGTLICGVLGAMWIWNGAIYHMMLFKSINPVASVFGVLFIVQGLLFLLFGVWRKDLQFRVRNSPAGWLGMVLVLYAMVGYPLLAQLYGHAYPATPMFGVAPCPTTIFTFGLILWGLPTMPRVILPILFIWSVIGASAAVVLGMKEDFAMPAAAAAVLVFYVAEEFERRHRMPAPVGSAPSH